MRRISPPVVRANVSDCDDLIGMGRIITVRFDPVRMAIGARAAVVNDPIARARRIAEQRRAKT